MINGTRDVLMQLSQKSFIALYDGCMILGIFIDFSKAFDTINHSVLVHKLHSFYVFHSTALNWFKS